jgi:hypothetical protein
MTEIVRQSELQIMWLDDRRATLTGPAGRVGAALAQLRGDGSLARATDPLPTGNGGVLVTVTVFPAAPAVPAAAPRSASAWTPRIVLALVAVIGAVLITCGVLALRGLAWVGAHGPLLLGLAVLAAAAVAFAALNAMTGGRLVEVLVRVRVK